MSSSVARERLQVLQIYRLIQRVHEADEVQVEKMVQLGVPNLINLTEPQDGIGVLHVAVSANNLGNPVTLKRTRCSRSLLWLCGKLCLSKKPTHLGDANISQ